MIRVRVEVLVGITNVFGVFADVSVSRVINEYGNSLYMECCWNHKTILDSYFMCCG